MITLYNIHADTTLTLSDRLQWTDEFSRSPVVNAVRWGTWGDAQIHVGEKQAGLPITLDGRDTQAWISRDACATLRAWAAQPGAIFKLTLRGSVYYVVFDHSNPPAFDADPIWQLLDSEQHAQLMYRPQFKFLEVEEPDPDP